MVQRFNERMALKYRFDWPGVVLKESELRPGARHGPQGGIEEFNAVMGE